MEENIATSKKKSLRKQLRILWCCVAAVVLVSFVFVAIKFNPIRKSQNYVIEKTELRTSRFENRKVFRGRLLKEIHDYYTRPKVSLPNSPLVEELMNIDLEEIRAWDRMMADELSKKGWGHYGRASTCLSYGTMTHYCRKIYPVIFYGDMIIILLAGIAHLLYLLDKKAELYIRHDVVVGKKSSGQTIQFLLKDIKSVESTKTHGLKISGAGIKYKIHLIENGEQMKSTILEMLADIPKEQPVVTPVNGAGAIKEYKELLDSGVITQEEFNAKKRQLLGL